MNGFHTVLLVSPSTLDNLNEFVILLPNGEECMIEPTPLELVSGKDFKIEIPDGAKVILDKDKSIYTTNNLEFKWLKDYNIWKANIIVYATMIFSYMDFCKKAKLIYIQK
jgi:hypothetical protein